MPEAGPEPGGAPVCCDVAVVGHVGLSATRTAHGEACSVGGSGFAVAASAAALIGRRAGLVAQIGDDLDREFLKGFGLNVEGVLQLPGRSPQLRIEQFDDGTRSFSSDLGAAAQVRLNAFPAAYLKAGYVHLGTAPPGQQRLWLRYLRSQACTARISVDMFEHFVAADPDSCRAVCDDADLVFLNETEFAGLYDRGHGPGPKAPLILKRGSAGVQLIADGLSHDIPAPPAQAVDPTGGGEILAGVFLGLCARGLSDLDALRYAVRAAACCVEEFGVSGPRLRECLGEIDQEVSTRYASLPV
jgi:sugar/nucleoside kinase (ribokinase family)